MRHLFRMFRWIDYSFPPTSPDRRYRSQQTIGQDDFGNAIPYVPGGHYLGDMS